MARFQFLGAGPFCWGSMAGMLPLVRIAAASSCFLLAGVLAAQTAHSPAMPPGDQIANIPSEAEIGELTAKATEKVEVFKRTLDAVKPYLDKADPSAYRKDMDAAENANMILGVLKKNGRTGYGLVSLLTVLDDLDLDATQDSTAILLYGTQALTEGKQPPDGMTAAVMMLTSSASNFYDISELVMHATLRFVGGEEAVLNQVFADKK